MAQNKVWVRPTTLLSRKYAKIGWLLRSHSTYTHLKTAAADLIQRIGANPPVELELFPHALTHMGANDEIVCTHALKIVMAEKDVETVLNRLIECLTRTPNEFKYSATVDFKPILFQNNPIGRED